MICVLMFFLVDVVLVGIINQFLQVCIVFVVWWYFFDGELLVILDDVLDGVDVVILVSLCNVDVLVFLLCFVVWIVCEFGVCLVGFIVFYLGYMCQDICFYCGEVVSILLFV